jgi:hypothetical protein
MTVLPEDLDVAAELPPELARIVSQGLIDLSPWHVMPRQLARTRMLGLRQRYRSKYVPFARRQDNDDLACIEPGAVGTVVVVHDFATEGSERVRSYETFWAWFRAAIEDMIEFEP